MYVIPRFNTSNVDIKLRVMENYEIHERSFNTSNVDIKLKQD